MKDIIEKKILKYLPNDGSIPNIKTRLVNYIMTGSNIFEMNLNQKELSYLILEYLDVLNYYGADHSHTMKTLYYSIVRNAGDDLDTFYSIMQGAAFPYNLYFSVVLGGYNNVQVPSINLYFNLNNIGNIYLVLDELTERERTVVLARYKDKKTIKDIANGIGISKSRIEQNLDKALRKMRHPSRLKKICTSHAMEDLGLSKETLDILIRSNVYNVDNYIYLLKQNRPIRIFITGFTMDMYNEIMNNKFINEQYINLGSANERAIKNYKYFSGGLQLVTKSKEISECDKLTLKKYAELGIGIGMKKLLETYSSNTINTFINMYRNELADQREKTKEKIQKDRQDMLEKQAAVSIDVIRKNYSILYNNYLVRLKDFQEKELEKTRMHFKNIESMKDTGLISVYNEAEALIQQIDFIKEATAKIIRMETKLNK